MLPRLALILAVPLMCLLPGGCGDPTCQELRTCGNGSIIPPDASHDGFPEMDGRESEESSPAVDSGEDTDSSTLSESPANGASDSGTDSSEDVADSMTPGGPPDSEAGRDSSPCPTGRGPTMVNWARNFCIDSTEVTNGQYDEFIASKPSAAPLESFCAWKQTFTPPSRVGGPMNPVVFVDWCEAYAYCKWAGKELCGAIGTTGHGSPVDYMNANKDHWFAARSKSGTRDLPYGASYMPGVCVGDDYDGVPGFQITTDESKPVGSASGCQGGYPGIFDMIGNVDEWEDSCDTWTGEGDTCMHRGGSFGGTLATYRCSDNGPLSTRDSRFGNVGFRCCSGRGF
jgi:sulfatase modifying factor 1